MQDNLLRYRCQLALPHFSELSQQQLQNARVLIAGAGGLGCPAAQYLAAAGVGTMGIADFDTISTTNLHRQILYTPDDIGKKKVTVAATRLKQQNPFITLLPHDICITSATVADLIDPYDIIVDGTDNFDAKYLLNDACVLKEKPLVYGAIHQYEGQVSIWNNKNTDGTRSPNYRDLFPEITATSPNCSESGVVPTLAGIIGCFQANEVLKLITGIGIPLAGKLLIFDAQTMQSRILELGDETKTSITKLSAPEVPLVTVEELRKSFKHDRYQLIDIRTSDERTSFHIGGTHIPLEELDSKPEQLKTDKPIIFYCATGKRSMEAVKKAKKSGITKVYSLKGGLKAWMETSS